MLYRLLVQSLAFILLVESTSDDTVVNKHKVRLDVYGEGGCPYTRDFITGPLNQMLKADGVIDIVDLQLSMFGNTYFVTSGCGGNANDYDADVRNCFNKLCGTGSSAHPAECFKGDIVCQHGGEECSMDRYAVCAKDLARDSLQYVTFVNCMAVQYDLLEQHSETSWPKEIVSKCAESSKLSFDHIEACHSSNLGDMAVIMEAKVTPGHEGVPWVVLDGTPVPEAEQGQLLEKVCSAYTGSKIPPGCPQPSVAKTVQASSFLHPAGQVATIAWQNSTGHSSLCI